MVLGAYIVGASSFLATATPSGILFDEVKLYNKSGYDNIIILDSAKTASQQIAFFQIGSDYDWTEDVILYAEFENNLLAGNINVANIDHFVLYRYDSATGQNIKIREDIEPDDIDTYDFTNVLDKSYIYYLTAIGTDNTSSNSLASNSVDSSYYGWFLIDYDDEIMFKFDIDLSSQGLTTNMNAGIFVSPFAAKPTVERSDTNYMSGTLNCKLGYIDTDNNCEYTDTITLYNLLVSVMTNGNKKILKDRRGNTWEIEITGNLGKQYADVINSQPVTISFPFTEVRARTS